MSFYGSSDRRNMREGSGSKALTVAFPEIGAGGYTSRDGTVEFYGRVQALLRPTMHVLDFGAGRGARGWAPRRSYSVPTRTAYAEGQGRTHGCLRR